MKKITISLIKITTEPTQCSICGKTGFSDEELGGAFLDEEIVCPACVAKVRGRPGLELIDGPFKLAVIKRKGPGKVELIK